MWKEYQCCSDLKIYQKYSLLYYPKSTFIHGRLNIIPGSILKIFYVYKVDRVGKNIKFDKFQNLPKAFIRIF